MRINKKLKTIFELVLEQITDIYLYFLGFYVVCLILSCFFERWKLFFNWPAFHLSIIFLGILSLISDKGRKFILSKIEVVKPNGKIKFVFSREIFIDLISFFLRKITKKHYLKIILIIVILIYALSKGINPINFFILAYALVSILFVIESRIAAGIALLFLTSCPILLIFKKEAMAETMAIYAYYFLVITVITQIREYWQEERAKKVIHN